MTHLFRSSTASLPQTPTRISLVDNTAPPAPSITESRSHSPSSDDNNARSRFSLEGGKRETLRRAIAERRYKRWSVNPNSAETTDIEDDVPDERAGGVVVDRDSGSGGVDGAGDQRTGESSRRGREGAGGQVRRTKSGRTEVAEIDVLYENQRGAFICGIPLFSSKSLLNFDPSAWTNVHHHNSPVSILNAQLPDPSWVWDWKSWYVDMTGDVDEEGWAYSFSFSPAFAWHGNHVWFHSFVRRRRWLRKRVKLPPSGQRGNDGTEAASLGAGHRLNNDYFTIHSKRGRDSWYADGSRSKRRSVLEGNGWEGDDESEIEVEIKDIPTLMRVVKKARLDREKMEAIMKFVEDGGDELTYLAEKIPILMNWMIFQASRRALLAHLLEYVEQYEAGNVPTVIRRAISPPIQVVATTPGATTPSEETPDQPQPERPSSTDIKGKEPSEDAPDVRRRKVDNLRKVLLAADAEVKKIEFWSDLKEVARKGESVTAANAEEGWDGLGISGPSVGNEKILGGAGNGGVPEERERVDTKGKGRATD